MSDSYYQRVAFYQYSVSANGVDLSSIPFVGLWVGLSGECTVAKRLNGSGCHLWWWVGSVEGMGVLNMDGYRRRGRAYFRLNLGRPIVTKGTLMRSCARATRSSQNYFEEGLVLCVRMVEHASYFLLFFVTLYLQFSWTKCFHEIIFWRLNVDGIWKS